MKPFDKSFHGKQNKGYSQIIATLLLIVIAVTLAVVAYGFVMGYIGGPNPPINQTNNDEWLRVVIEVSDEYNHAVDCYIVFFYNGSLSEVGAPSASGTYVSALPCKDGSELIVEINKNGVKKNYTFTVVNNGNQLDSLRYGPCFHTEITLESTSSQLQIAINYQELYDLNGGYYPVKYVELKILREDGFIQEQVSLEEARYWTNWYYAYGEPITIQARQGNATFSQTIIPEKHSTSFNLFWDGLCGCCCSEVCP